MAKKVKSAPIQGHEIQQSMWNKDVLRGILARHKNKKIFVVGDIGIDRYTIGTVERISPEAPVPIVLVVEEKLKLGLAANVADNIQALGAIPILLGVVGKDRGAEDLRSLLKSNHIQSTHLVVDGSRRTVLKERVVSERQQLVRVDYESLHKIDQKIENRVLALFKKQIAKVDGVVIEDYAKGLISENMLKSILGMAKRAGKKVAIDPNIKTPVEYYQGATVLTPNTKEAEHLSGIMIRDHASLLKSGFKLLKATHSEHIVITRGKDGMAIFSKGNSEVRIIPTYAREVYDVSGAGDTVISVLMLSLVAGASIEEASVLGNLAAGIEVGKRGTATVSPEEIQSSLDFFEVLSGE